MGHIVMDILNGYKVTESIDLIDDGSNEPGLLCKAPGKEPRVAEKDPVYPQQNLPPSDKNKKRKTITDVAEFAWECTKYIDRHGQVLGKNGNPMTSFLEMRGQNDEVDSQFSAFRAAQSNGSWKIEIWQKLPDNKKKLVLSVSGNFMVRPFNTNVHEYIAGDWEKNFYE